MGAKRSAGNSPDEFQAVLESVAKDVLGETRGQEAADDPAIRLAFVVALGRSLRTHGLSIAYLTVVPGDVRT